VSKLTVPDIRLPVPSLVLLVGASGSGKSTFALRHFLATEVISSDRCRALITDDEADQSASKEAFELVHAIAERRLAFGRLTVIDATSVQPSARMQLVELARRCVVPAVAIVFHLSEETCLRRNAARTTRVVEADVLRRQVSWLVESLPTISSEGFAQVYVLTDEANIDAATVERTVSQAAVPRS
jgi:protein phosphatase